MWLKIAWKYANIRYLFLRYVYATVIHVHNC